jgi:hypothetical protein
MSLNSTHVATNDRIIFFLWLNNNPSSIYKTHGLYPFIYGCTIKLIECAFFMIGNLLKPLVSRDLIKRFLLVSSCSCALFFFFYVSMEE